MGPRDLTPNLHCLLASVSGILGSRRAGNDYDLGEAWEAQAEFRDTGTPLFLGNYLLLYTKLRALRSDDQRSHKGAKLSLLA